MIEKFKEANLKVRAVCDLKGKNRVNEQKKLVTELKQDYHSYRNRSRMSGILLKTVHTWCSNPQTKLHKLKALAHE